MANSNNGVTGFFTIMRSGNITVDSALPSGIEPVIAGITQEQGAKIVALLAAATGDVNTLGIWSESTDPNAPLVALSMSEISQYLN